MKNKGSDKQDKIVQEYYNEAGKMVRISINGIPTFGEDNSAVENQIARNFTRFLVENPIVLESDVLSKGGTIQINFPD